MLPANSNNKTTISLFVADFNLEQIILLFFMANLMKVGQIYTHCGYFQLIYLFILNGLIELVNFIA